MASDVEIANAALSKLGEPGLLAFSDDSVAGRLATRTFADLRDALLREHPWNFASKRATLAAEVTAPDWGFARAYPVPADYLRLIELDNPSRFPYRIESGRILSDLTSPIRIRYVKRVTSADEMDVLFRDALASRLAMEWAEPLSQTTSLTQEMAQLYQQKLRIARVADGQEDTHRRLVSSSFVDARGFGRGNWEWW